MKIALVVGLVLLVVISAGCVEYQEGKLSVDTSKISELKSKLESKDTIPLVIGSKMVKEGMEITIEDLIMSEHLWYWEDMSMGASEGARFLLVKIKVKNVADSKRELLYRQRYIVLYKGSEIHLRYPWIPGILSRPSEYRINDTSIKPIEKGMYLSESIFPNVERQGWLIYEVPQDLTYGEAQLYLKPKQS